MHMPRIAFVGMVATTALAGSTAAQAPTRTTTDSVDRMTQDSAERILKSWPMASREAGERTIEKYGAPDIISDRVFVWFETGPWMKTVLSRDPVQHEFPMPHQDVLLQEVAYQVPVDRFDDLAEFDGSVIAERTKGTIAARCDREEANLLAVNLSHDIVTGKREVDDAREFYAETIQALKRGEKPSYTQRLQFDVVAHTGDPGKPAANMDRDK